MEKIFEYKRVEEINWSPYRSLSSVAPHTWINSLPRNFKYVDIRKCGGEGDVLLDCEALTRCRLRYISYLRSELKNIRRGGRGFIRGMWVLESDCLLKMQDGGHSIKIGNSCGNRTKVNVNFHRFGDLCKGECLH